MNRGAAVVAAVYAAACLIIFAAPLVPPETPPDIGLLWFAYVLPGAMLLAHATFARYAGWRGSVASAFALLSAAAASVGLWMFGANIMNVIENNDSSAGAIGIGIMLLFVVAGIAFAATATMLSAGALVMARHWDWRWLAAAAFATVAGWLGVYTALGQNVIPSLIALGVVGAWWAGAAYWLLRAPDAGAEAEDAPPIPPSP